MTYQIVPAAREHIPALVANLRAQDEAEIRSGGSTPEQALTEAFDKSNEPLAVLFEGRVLAIFGVAKPHAISDYGMIWMLGSKEVPKHTKMLLRASKAYVKRELRKTSHLVNYVDAEYQEAVRWLRWLGFTVSPATPRGPNGELFHKIEIKETPRGN
jgi:hypothetical protein